MTQSLILYPLLSTTSKRAIRRKKKKLGHPYFYRPRKILLQRLAAQLGWTEQQVYDRLKEERRFLLQYPQYY